MSPGRGPVRDAPPRPTRDMLRDTPVHVIVRDYPETLRVLREREIDVPAAAAEPLTAIGLDDPDELFEALLAVTAWRPD